MAKYPYYVPTKNVYKPWIRVNLGYKKTHKITPAAVHALIDSGADVCFCSTDIGIKTLPRETPIILGQRGFFDHFKITFDLQNKEIEIT